MRSLSFDATWPTIAEQWRGPTDAQTFLRRALALVESLASGQRDALVGSLGPHTIHIDPAGELHIAAQADAGPALATAAYTAPERLRSGGRRIDRRADLYSLGVMLYEQLLGVLPFQANDLLGWIHCHIAHPPRPPAEVDPDVSPTLAGILQKLLMKAPEERYQSLPGLRHDLERCRTALAETGTIAPFALAERDIPQSFRLPQRLYGRAAEQAALQAAAVRVAEVGAPALVLVSGYAGVGKSALVHELVRPISRRYGFFVAGKFEQYRRDTPYSTMVQAFGELARQLLMASESRLAAWRQQLHDELGAAIQIVVDVIPEMELILGRHPPVPPLPLGEAQNRFNRVFRQFVGVFARAEHPLALFLDDLQWADAASLRLLQHLVTHPDVRHLLVICAYREHEIDVAHPWTAARAAISAAGVDILQVALGPLARTDVEALVADTFGCTRARADELAAILAQKTRGNPFFVGRLLTTLHTEGLIRFAADGERWTWDLEAVRAREYTDSVVELMILQLRGLPAPAQESLRVAACLGTDFSPTVLAEILGRTAEDVLADLAPALAAGLLLPRGPALQFLHDRVQQAAHALIPDDERAAVHLGIGRHLRARLTAEAPGEPLFEVVNHLNAAIALIADDDERIDLARLNLQAGVRAKQTTAYVSAQIYLAAGMALLPDDAWSRLYDLQFALHRERSECECLCGRNDVAEALFDAALHHAANTLDRAQIQTIRIGLYYSTGRLRECLDVGGAALRQLGVDFPAGPDERRALLGPEIGRLTARFAALDIEGLEHAPATLDPLQRVTSQVLVALIPPAYYLDLDLFTLVILRLVDISLTHGETDASVIGYATYALLLTSVLGEYELAGRLARMTIRRVDAIADPFLKTKVHTIYGWFTGVWHEPFRRIPPHLQVGYQSGLECGDLIYAAFALLGLDTCLLSRADDLAEVESQWADHARLFAEMQHSVAEQTAAVVLDALPRLRGSGVHTPGDPEVVLRTTLAGQMNSAVGTYYVLRAQRAYILRDYAEAQAMGDMFEQVKVAGLLGTYFCTEGVFYRALAAAARHDVVPEADRPALRELLRDAAASLASHAARCPEGFADRSALLAAEVARLEGRPLAALQAYEQAASLAASTGFRANEALAHELAARLCDGLGLAQAAAFHLRRAHATYRRWGALVKVRALAAAHPELAFTEEPRPSIPSAPFEPPPALDVMSVIKASHALSGEVVLGRLLTALMHVAIEHAGAERGLFLDERDGALRIAATARVGSTGTAVDLTAPTDTTEPYAAAIVQYVRRTRERVILDDPASGGMFVMDPYVTRVRPRSVLCTPVVRGPRLVGILYLENNWMPGAFTPERSSLLELIATQAAISIENANLYADLARENDERRLAERTLQSSEERLRQLVESVSVVPWEADVHGDRFTYIGPQATALLGYPPEAWHGPTNLLIDITEDGDRDALRMHRARARSEPALAELEFRVRDALGRPRWLHSIIAAASPNATHYRGFLFDCTTRKQAEADLRDKLAIIEAQEEAIRALSTPIIEVWDGVITMPLFGTIDHTRAAQMHERLLDTIVRTRARVAILDLTGVGTLDTHTADHIIRLVHAVQLLGARGIVVGIRPDVAQAIVALGVDLTRIRTLANLREALLLCMQGGWRAIGAAKAQPGPW